MKATISLTALALTTAGLVSVLAVNPTPPASSDTPSADAILRQMSDQLGAAQKFSFKVHRSIDAGLAAGDGLPGNALIEVTVQRPDKVATRATTPNDVRQLYADGKNLSLFDKKKKLYATVPMAVSLDELPSQLAKTFGFTPPVAEFLISDLYKDLSSRAERITYAGTGNRCHRIVLSGKLADSELWIGVGDLLPRRMTATVKGENGNVGLTLEFSDWNLNAKTKDQDFSFTPPKGSVQIHMMTVAEIEDAHKASKIIGEKTNQ